MSFLSELQNKKKRLKETETYVTLADGRRYRERRGSSEYLGASCGFVVDTAPDETPARIAAGLFLGSQDCAAPAVLARHGIRRVLSLGVPAGAPVRCKFVPCLDLPEAELAPVLRESLPFLREAVLAGRPALVHCNAGVSRAAAVAVAYLMQYEGLGFAAAYAAVKAARPAAQPNDGFRRQLMKLQPGNVL